MIKHKRHIQRSIFLKLLFMLLLAGIIIIFSVGFFFNYMFSQSPHDVVLKNARNYANYIIKEIGAPPDTIKAKEIARQNSLIIYYEGQGLKWTTQKNLDFLKSRHFRKKHLGPGWARNFYVVHLPAESGKYIFGLNFNENIEYHKLLIFLLLFFIALVVFGLYMSIRRILRPLKWLNEGVQEVGKGNFEYQVKIWKPDQLGQLSASFNSMTKKIKEMIFARDQLLLDVSHELRSPLTRMKVAMEFLPEDKNKQTLSEDIAEMETMLSEILETERLNSKHNSLKMEAINISELIKEFAGKYQHNPPGIKIKRLAKDGIIKADGDRIRTCLKNVIENALKYSAPSAKPVQIKTEESHENLLIQIQDAGSGIPEEDLPYIFEPFYRVDKSRAKSSGGYGLGMSLCKKIIEAHKGTIEIESALNVGTLVTIKIPKV